MGDNYHAFKSTSGSGSGSGGGGGGGLFSVKGLIIFSVIYVILTLIGKCK